VPKFKALIFLALVCFGPCQTQKEAVAAEAWNPDKGVSRE
jgi:hypothetical protein